MKELTWMLMGIAAIVGVIALTAMGRLPPEVIAGLAGVIVSTIFGQQQYRRLDESWQHFYESERERWAG